MPELPTRRACPGVVLASLLAALLAPPVLAQAPPPDPVVIGNGAVELGVSAFGTLTVEPGPLERPARVTARVGPVTGLRLLRGAQPALEGVAGGCCEGWGVADAASTLTGHVGANRDPVGLALLSFVGDGDSATSVTETTGHTAGVPGSRPNRIVVAPPTLRVTQEYGPSPDTPYLFRNVVTIANVGAIDASDVRYRRVVDWDVEPTAGNELVTIDGTASVNLLYSNDGGFDSPNPLGAGRPFALAQCTGTEIPNACTGFFTDAGPRDHGAHLDLGFGGLAAGHSLTFTLFYGAAPSEAAALSAVHAAGGEVWSFAQASAGDGGPLGVPATFVLAFARGSAPAGPSPSLTMHAPATVGVAEDGSPEPLDVTADVRNFGGAAADNLSVDLEPDAGLTVTGADPASLGSLAPGAQTTASWHVQPAETCADTTYHIGATATWDGAAAPLRTTRAVVVHGSCSRVYGYLTGTDRAGVHGLAGATVELCDAGLTCTPTTTDTFGRYEFAGLVGAASYTVVAHGVAPFTNPSQQVSNAIATTRGSDNRHDFGWTNIEPIAPGTTLGGPGLVGFGLVPTIYWNAPTTLRKAACDPPASPSSARYRVTSGDGSQTFVDWTPMTQLGDGSFEVTIPPLFPSHGPARIEIEVTCGANPPVVTGFDVYIDPSGLVRDQDGNPIVGAQVTLYRYEGLVLDYVPVSDGSAVMSPANRTNPDLTDAAGHFGWDVIAGNYKVRAQKAGCHAPGSSVAYVETANLPIPPPVTDLDMRLECDRPGPGGGSPTPGLPLLGAGPIATPRDRTAPVLSGLRVVPKRFRAVKAIPGRRAKAKFAFRLSEPASVRFSIARIATGRRVGGLCVPGTARGSGRCTRYVFVRALTQRTRTSGAQSVAFGGLTRTRRLLPAGRYRLTGVPTDRAGNAGVRKATTFTIVR